MFEHLSSLAVAPLTSALVCWNMSQILFTCLKTMGFFPVTPDWNWLFSWVVAIGSVEHCMKSCAFYMDVYIFYFS